jgi:hypothetical protein
MKTDIIGRQPRKVTPGGFSSPNRNSGRRFHMDAKEVREAATRVLENRGQINHPTSWENTAVRKGRP